MNFNLKEHYELSKERISDEKNKKMIELLGVNIRNLLCYETGVGRDEFRRLRERCEENKQKSGRRVLLLRKKLHKFNSFIEKTLERFDKNSNGYLDQMRVDLFQSKKSNLKRIRQAFNDCVRKKENVQKSLETELIALNERICETKESKNIENFAIRLERESNGKIRLEKLSSESNQYRRTCKAVRGSVRSSLKSLGNLVTLNVFQIRNEILLKHFRESRSLSGKRAKVKGLFCALKSLSNVKRMIALAFRISPSPEMYAEIFQGVITQSEHDDEDDIEIFLKNTQECGSSGVIKVSDLLFSKYSTVSGPIKDLNNSKGLHYLVLCRVLINRIFVTSKQRRTFPEITDEMSRSFDTIYCPSRDEFRVLDSAHVLPEFIIQCRWNNNIAE